LGRNRGGETSQSIDALKITNVSISNRQQTGRTYGIEMVMLVPSVATSVAPVARMLTGNELLVAPAGISHDDGAAKLPVGEEVSKILAPLMGAGTERVAVHVVVLPDLGKQLKLNSCGIEGINVTRADTYWPPVGLATIVTGVADLTTFGGV
jgi:hypothetical protein